MTVQLVLTLWLALFIIYLIITSLREKITVALISAEAFQCNVYHLVLEYVCYLSLPCAKK
jgi:hypothetical protein